MVNANSSRSASTTELRVYMPHDTSRSMPLSLLCSTSKYLSGTGRSICRAGCHRKRADNEEWVKVHDDNIPLPLAGRQ